MARAYGVTDWAALRASWSATLERLATDFASGVATIDPLPSACAHCHLTALCRRHEHDTRAALA
jgi:hypothetical protein